MSDRDDLADIIEPVIDYTGDLAYAESRRPRALNVAGHVLRAGWVPEWQYTDLAKRTGALDQVHAQLRAERDALAATVERVRVVLQGIETERHNAGCEGEPDCAACITADLRTALAAEPSP